jgi:hypothetical protein
VGTRERVGEVVSWPAPDPDFPEVVGWYHGSICRLSHEDQCGFYADYTWDSRWNATREWAARALKWRANLPDAVRRFVA